MERKKVRPEKIWRRRASEDFKVNPSLDESDEDDSDYEACNRREDEDTESVSDLASEDNDSEE